MMLSAYGLLQYFRLLYERRYLYMADFNDLKDKIGDLNATQDTTSQFDPADIQENKGISVLCYLGLLLLIPLLVKKDSRYVRFHANQGLVLFIVEAVLSIVVGIGSLIPIVGILIAVVCGLVDLVCLVMMILGIVNAANGKAKELPVIGGIKLLK